MAIRIRPFQNYEEHDLINMYALDPTLANDSTADTGKGDLGVLVTVSKGDLDAPVLDWQESEYLGKQHPKHLGSAKLYPVASLQVKPAKKTDVFLGVTMMQTAKYDANGNKLINNRDTMVASHAVLPGQAVPVLTRGWLDFNVDCFESTYTDQAIGDKLTISATEEGKFAKATEATDPVVGIIWGTGTSQDEDAVKYYRVQFSNK